MINSDVRARDFLTSGVYHEKGESNKVKKFRDRTFTEIVKLVWPFPFSVICGGVVVAMCPIEWIQRVGEGFLVAGIVGLVIELTAAGILIGEVTDELSSRLIGYRLPTRARNLIHEIVHETKLVRREYLAEYRIVENDKGGVTIETVVSYRVVNNGSGSEDYTPVLQEEGIYDPRLISLNYGGKNENPTPEREAKTGVLSWKPSRSIRLTTSAATDALDNLPDDKVCSVRWHYAEEMPLRYSSVISFAGVTETAKVILIAKPEGFEFHASEDKECKCSHVEGSSIWEYNRAFIREQHVRIWWGPKQGDATRPVMSKPE